MNQPMPTQTLPPTRTMDDPDIEVSIVMPCLNEAETIEVCIRKTLNCLAENGIRGEVVVADNGSEDGSIEIARRAGARVIHVKEKGYGAAVTAGFDAARGKYLIMGDADDSYDFSNLMPFIHELRNGYDLVMGSRFKGGIAPGAMPWHHRYIGNPVLTGVLNLFHRTGMSDAHCGLRALAKSAYQKMDLRTTGMEFASEMLVKARAQRLNMTEVPTTLSPDGRSRPPHLRSFRDGWRHLRLLLLLSPSWTLIYPSLLMLVTGIGLLVGFAWNLRSPNAAPSDHLWPTCGALLLLVGLQGVVLGCAARLFALQEELGPPSGWAMDRLRSINLERGLTVGVLLVALGTGLVLALGQVLTGPTLIAVGLQSLTLALFCATLARPRRRPKNRARTDGLPTARGSAIAPV